MKSAFECQNRTSSLYIRSDSKSLIAIILYVDNLVIRGENLADVTKVKSLLSSRFEMKDMQELHYFLDIEVNQTLVWIMISQWHYILNLLYKFGMTKCRLGRLQRLPTIDFTVCLLSQQWTHLME